MSNFNEMPRGSEDFRKQNPQLFTEKGDSLVDDKPKKKRRERTPVPTEYQECVRIADYLQTKGWMFSHLAQSTWTNSWGVKKRNEAMGVNSGVPDYIIIIPKDAYHNILVFAEIKRMKGGQVSKTQNEWLQELALCNNTDYDVVYSFIAKGYDDFVKQIERIKGG